MGPLRGGREFLFQEQSGALPLPEPKATHLPHPPSGGWARGGPHPAPAGTPFFGPRLLACQVAQPPSVTVRTRRSPGEPGAGADRLRLDARCCSCYFSTPSPVDERAPGAGDNTCPGSTGSPHSGDDGQARSWGQSPPASAQGTPTACCQGKEPVPGGDRGLNPPLLPKAGRAQAESEPTPCRVFSLLTQHQPSSLSDGGLCTGGAPGPAHPGVFCRVGCRKSRLPPPPPSFHLDGPPLLPSTALLWKLKDK